MKTLIVDDIESNLYLLKCLLEGHDHEVIEANNGLEALEKLTHEGADLIISDILMPHMDGFMLCKEVKQNPLLSHIPFIIYTATYTGHQDEALALELGADRFLIKPCDPEEFIFAVNEVISNTSVLRKSPGQAIAADADSLKLYNQRLVNKLETKMLQVEKEVQAHRKTIIELNRMEDLLNASQSVSKLGGWDWDLELNEMHWTDQTYKIYELEPEEIVSQGIEFFDLCLDHFTTEDRLRLQDAMNQCISHGDPFTIEGDFISAKGNHLIVLMSGKPVYETGIITKVVGMLQDVTERRRAEIEKSELKEQLRQTQKLESIGQLAGGIAHDFNNLLTVILGYAEDISQNMDSGDPVLRDIEEIIKAGKRALGLTRQLLTFSRKQMLQLQTIDMCEVICEMNKMLIRLIGENIDFSVENADPKCYVKADRNHLEQVVMNLVINAKEAMPNGGKLMITTRKITIFDKDNRGYRESKPGNYVELVVSDTGCGMDSETILRLFEPFFTTKEKSKGTGLGLSTMYGIIKQAGGDIQVLSEPGMGSTFMILFPLTEDAPREIPEDLNEIDISGNQELIMVVEDDPAVCDLIEKMILKLGYRCLAVRAAAAAIHSVIVEGVLPDLVITDIIMPYMNGKELVDQLLEHNPSLKVLMMSGYSDNLLSQNIEVESSIPLMQKPFNKYELGLRIKDLLNADKQNGPKHLSILMIDDDEDMRLLFSRQCKKHGHILYEADSLSSGLQILASTELDVVLIDLNFPDSDGITILHELRIQGFTLPAIIVSGNISQIDLESLQPLGCIAVLEKSHLMSELIKAVEQILS